MLVILNEALLHALYRITFPLVDPFHMIENNKEFCKTPLIHSIVMDITIARVAETNLHIQNFVYLQ